MLTKISMCLYINIDKEIRANTNDMDIWHIEEPYLPSADPLLRHAPPGAVGAASTTWVTFWENWGSFGIVFGFDLIVLYWILSSLHTGGFHMTCTNTLSLTANITGCEIPGNSRVAHCAEAQNWNLSRPARPAVVWNFCQLCKFSRKQCSFFHILQVHTHLNVNFFHNCSKIYTFCSILTKRGPNNY